MLLSVLKFLCQLPTAIRLSFPKKVSGCRASARRESCRATPQKAGRGRSATSRMRCSHSLQRESTKRNPRFPFFPATTAEKGEILPFGVYPRPSSKKGTQGVCVVHRAVICAPIGFRRQRKEQGNNAEVSVLFAAVFILHTRTPLQCCNLHLGSTTSIWYRPCVKQYRQYFSWLRSRYGGRGVVLRLAELRRLFDCLVY